MQHRHHIERVVFDLQTETRQGGFEVQEAASTIFNRYIETLLNRLLTEFDIPGHHLRIKQITLNTGAILVDEFNEEWPKRIEAALREELSQQIHYYKQNQSSSNLEAILTPAFYLDVFQRYLETGIMGDVFSPTEINPEDVLALLLKTNTAAVIQLIQQFGKKESVRKRLAYHLEEPSVITIINVLEPANAAVILQYVQDVDQLKQQDELVQTETQEFKRAKYYFVLTYLLTQRGSIFNTREFVRSLLKQMAAHYNLNYKALLLTFMQHIDEFILQERTTSLPTLIKEVFVQDFPNPNWTVGNSNLTNATNTNEWTATSNTTTALADATEFNPKPALSETWQGFTASKNKTIHLENSDLTTSDAFLTPSHPYYKSAFIHFLNKGYLPITANAIGLEQLQNWLNYLLKTADRNGLQVYLKYNATTKSLQRLHTFFTEQAQQLLHIAEPENGTWIQTSLSSITEKLEQQTGSLKQTGNVTWLQILQQETFISFWQMRQQPFSKARFINTLVKQILKNSNIAKPNLIRLLETDAHLKPYLSIEETENNYLSAEDLKRTHAKSELAREKKANQLLDETTTIALQEETLEAQQSALLFYLRYGHLPWWLKGDVKKIIPYYLEVVLRPKTRMATLQQLSPWLSDFTISQRLLELLQYDVTRLENKLELTTTFRLNVEHWSIFSKHLSAYEYRALQTFRLWQLTQSPKIIRSQYFDLPFFKNLHGNRAALGKWLSTFINIANAQPSLFYHPFVQQIIYLFIFSIQHPDKTTEALQALLNQGSSTSLFENDKTFTETYSGFSWQALWQFAQQLANTTSSKTNSASSTSLTTDNAFTSIDTEEQNNSEFSDTTPLNWAEESNIRDTQKTQDEPLNWVNPNSESTEIKSNTTTDAQALKAETEENTLSDFRLTTENKSVEIDQPLKVESEKNTLTNKTLGTEQTINDLAHQLKKQEEERALSTKRLSTDATITDETQAEQKLKEQLNNLTNTSTTSTQTENLEAKAEQQLKEQLNNLTNTSTTSTQTENVEAEAEQKLKGQEVTDLSTQEILNRTENKNTEQTSVNESQQQLALKNKDSLHPSISKPADSLAFREEQVKTKPNDWQLFYEKMNANLMLKNLQYLERAHQQATITAASTTPTVIDAPLLTRHTANADTFWWLFFDYLSTGTLQRNPIVNATQLASEAITYAKLLSSTSTSYRHLLVLLKNHTIRQRFLKLVDSPALYILFFNHFFKKNWLPVNWLYMDLWQLILNSTNTHSRIHTNALKEDTLLYFLNTSTTSASTYLAYIKKQWFKNERDFKRLLKQWEQILKSGRFTLKSNLSLLILEQFNETQFEIEAKKEKERKQAAQKKEALKQAEDLPSFDCTLIENAGLILLWPFFAHYFQTLNLIHQNKFIGIKESSHAAYLMDYLVYGHEESKELNLTLNKILCDIPRATPLELRVPLTSNEKELSTQLLEIAISRWDIIKNTSIEGFRESFLQRRGKLEWQEEKIVLTIEPKAYDMLIDKLPWSISTIRLPWLTQTLQVKWRN